MPYSVNSSVIFFLSSVRLRLPPQNTADWVASTTDLSFLTVLEAARSTVQVQQGLVSGEDSLGLADGHLLAVTSRGGGGGTRMGRRREVSPGIPRLQGLSHRSLITSQRPHLQLCWGLGLRMDFEGDINLPP